MRKECGAVVILEGFGGHLVGCDEVGIEAQLLADAKAVLHCEFRAQRDLRSYRVKSSRRLEAMLGEDKCWTLTPLR